MKFYLVLNICDLNNSTFIEDFSPFTEDSGEVGYGQGGGEL